MKIKPYLTNTTTSNTIFTVSLPIRTTNFTTYIHDGQKWVKIETKIKVKIQNKLK